MKKFFIFVLCSWLLISPGVKAEGQGIDVTAVDENSEERKEIKTSAEYYNLGELYYTRKQFKTAKSNILK